MVLSYAAIIIVIGGFVNRIVAASERGCRLRFAVADPRKTA